MQYIDPKRQVWAKQIGPPCSIRCQDHRQQMYNPKATTAAPVFQYESAIRNINMAEMAFAIRHKIVNDHSLL